MPTSTDPTSPPHACLFFSPILLSLSSHLRCPLLPAPPCLDGDPYLVRVLEEQQEHEKLLPAQPFHPWWLFLLPQSRNFCKFLSPPDRLAMMRSVRHLTFLIGVPQTLPSWTAWASLTTAFMCFSATLHKLRQRGGVPPLTATVEEHQLGRHGHLGDKLLAKVVFLRRPTWTPSVRRCASTCSRGERAPIRTSWSSGRWATTITLLATILEHMHYVLVPFSCLFVCYTVLFIKHVYMLLWTIVNYWRWTLV
jgi:hypothetical protein